MTVDFVALAHNNDSSETFEAAVLSELTRTVGADAAFFLVKGAEQHFTALGLEPTVRAQMITRGERYAEELLPVKHAALAARGVAIDTEVCGIDYVRQTNYYNEVVRKVGGKHSLMAYVPWRGRIVAALMLGRNGKGFSAQDVSMVESSLQSLGLTRAVYGLPQVFAPLPSAPAVNPLRRLAFARRPHVLASVATSSGNLIVRDRAGFREMLARNGETELVWTRVSCADPTRSGWPYIELLHVASALAKRRGRVLFVGSGGAVGLRQFAAAYPGIAIDVVECEPAVIELARTWFGLSAIPGVTVHIAEGAAFIRAAAPGSWDVVVIDAFDAASFATQFADAAFLATVRRALRPGGAVACNVIGSLAGDGPVRRFTAAARAVFDEVRLLPVVDLDETFSGDALRNVVVVATRTD